jgi:hypothetical protein
MSYRANIYARCRFRRRYTGHMADLRQELSSFEMVGCTFALGNRKIFNAPNLFRHTEPKHWQIPETRPCLSKIGDLSAREFNMGLCKRNKFQPTSSLLELLQGLEGYQHQHDSMTVTSRPSYHAAEMVMQSDGVEPLSGSTIV